MHQQLVSSAGRWTSAIAALVVPPRCVACGRGTLPDARICDYCRSAIDHLPRGSLGAGTREHFAASFAAFPYEGPVREIVQALKFRGAVAAAREMAALIIERVPIGLLSGAALVPAPAHPARRRSRGFNQAALLAHEIAAICDLDVIDCLVRDHTRAPQATLSRIDRLSLPASSIRVEQIKAHSEKRATTGNSLEILPTKVVVLDDVTTTGVTLEVCASAIRERFSPSLGQSQLTPVIGALTFASTSAHPAH